jgi:nucleotide-binding universal stress UspA family protein
MSQRILVPPDGSTLAELALSEALTLAQLPDSKVVLLRVIPPIEAVISDGETFTIDQQWERRAGRARDYLRGIWSAHSGRRCTVKLRSSLATQQT